jgi:hypothetical protein
MRIPRVREMKESGEWQNHYISAPGLIEAYKTLPQGARGIEIGVAAGENICYTLDNCPNIGSIAAIDPWLPYTDCNGTGTQEIVDASYEVSIDNFKDYGDRVTVYRCTSDMYFDMYRAANKEAFDYIFVDGNHDYEYVLQDLRNFYTLVRPGGIISGHDLNVGSVVRALNDFLGTLPYNPQINQVPNCAWWFRKE